MKNRKIRPTLLLVLLGISACAPGKSSTSFAVPANNAPAVSTPPVTDDSSDPPMITAGWDASEWDNFNWE